MINPAKLLQIKAAWGTFSTNHPKFVKFIHAVGTDAIEEGTVIEITVTTPTGQKTGSNIKLTGTDVDLFRNLSDLVK